MNALTLSPLWNRPQTIGSEPSLAHNPASISRCFLSRINRTRGSGPHLPSRPGPCVLLTLLEPITLSARESNNRAFTAKLTPTQPGKEFQLTISAAPPFEPGKAQAQITLKTSSTNMPLLTVTAWAHVHPAPAAHPPPQALAPPAVPSPVQNSTPKSF